MGRQEASQTFEDGIVGSASPSDSGLSSTSVTSDKLFEVFESPFPQLRAWADVATSLLGF